MTQLLSINSYHYRRGGSDAVYFDHAALFESQGWRNAFFSMRHACNLPSEWERHFIDELEFGQDYGLLQKLRMAGKVVYSFEAQRRLRGLLAEFRPDVAHLHCIYHHHSPSILSVLKDAGVPMVLTAHDLKIACPAYKMLNRGGVCERCKTGSVLNVVTHRCVRDSLAASAIVAVESALHRPGGWLDSWRRHLDRVVCPSRFYVEKLVEWGWPRERLRHIPNVVDATAFEPDFRPGDGLLYFGRLAPEKGLSTLLRAAAKARVPLKIAGSGPEDEALRRLNDELGRPAEFLGFRSGADLHTLIRGARAVVLPSEWYENAPMSVLEAYALGKPVLGADIGGIPELIEPGRTGWIFKSGDVDALAEAIARVQATTDLEAMGRAAREQVLTRFNRDRYLQSMLALYAELGVRA